MDENNVPAENSNAAEVVAPEATEVEETVETVKEKLTKAEELANNYKIRAEKAEKAAKGIKPPEVVAKKEGDLSSKDVYALMDAKVPEEDIDEVVDYAKFKGITVREALKTSTIKASLTERSEQRKTASVTNTGASRRGSAVQSDEALMDEAAKGKIPEGDSEIKRLLWAKMKKETKKK